MNRYGLLTLKNALEREWLPEYGNLSKENDEKNWIVVHDLRYSNYQKYSLNKIEELAVNNKAIQYVEQYFETLIKYLAKQRIVYDEISMPLHLSKFYALNTDINIRDVCGCKYSYDSKTKPLDDYILFHANYEHPDAILKYDGNIIENPYKDYASMSACSNKNREITLFSDFVNKIRERDFELNINSFDEILLSCDQEIYVKLNLKNEKKKIKSL